MPQRLDSQSADFAARFSALLDVKREAAADVEAERARDHRRRGGARRPRADRTDARSSTASISPKSACASARPRSPPRRKPATPRRSTRSSSRATASRPITSGRSRRTSATPMRSASKWARKWTAIEAVGLYVPGGTAAYPSSVLMNAVPAKVAGCPRLVMVVPAPDGKLVAAGAGRREARRRRRDLPHRRRAGGGRARLRHAKPSSRSPRSSAPATPMWRRPSAWCSARSAST